MNLARPEAQDLDRGELALALGNVGVRQREHDGEAQRRRKDDDHVDHGVDQGEGAREVSRELSRRHRRERARVGGDLLGEGDLLLVRAPKLNKKPVQAALLSERALVGRLGHVEGVAEVVHDDGAHLNVRLVQRGVLDMQSVPRREVQHLLGVLCDGDARVGEVDGSARVVGKRHIVGEVGVIRHHHKRHGLLRAAVLHREAVDSRRDEARHLRIRVELGSDVLEIGRRGHEHEVVAGHARLPVLLARKRHHGVANAEPADKKRRAAGDAKDRHQEASLVAEDVPCRHLVEEREAPPERRDALEQDATARLGRLGAHEHGRLLGKLATASQRRRAHDAHGKEPHGHKRVGDIETQVERRQRIHGREDREQDERQHHEAQDVAGDAAREARRGGVDDVLGENPAAAVTERLVQADEPALLLDHARHRGQADKDGDHKEDNGQGGTDGLDGAGVGLHGRVACQALAVLNVPGGVVDGRYLVARVGDGGERIGALPGELGARRLKLGPAVDELLGAGIELGARGVELLLRVFSLGVELRLAGVELRAAGGDLRARGVEPRVGRRGLVELRAAGVDARLACHNLHHAISQSRELRQLTAQGLELCQDLVRVGARGQNLARRLPHRRRQEVENRVDALAELGGQAIVARGDLAELLGVDDLHKLVDERGGLLGEGKKRGVDVARRGTGFLLRGRGREARPRLGGPLVAHEGREHPHRAVDHAAVVGKFFLRGVELRALLGDGVGDAVHRTAQAVGDLLETVCDLRLV